MSGTIRVVAAAIFVWSLSLADPASGAYPDDCGSGLQPVENDCSLFPDIGFVGCCDSAGRSVWCDGGELYCIDCDANNPLCGWSVFGEFYDCGTDGGGDPSGIYPYHCDVCDPPCEAGFKCVAGQCEVCESDCTGKSCGSDGCGGSCGECSGSSSCVAGVCQTLGCESLPQAGCNGCYCEDCVCAMDDYCCSVEWDSICAGECVDLCGGCADLTNCGDDTCDQGVGEGCGNCPEDCLCDDGDACYKNACCTPDCTDKQCGSDGCGGECAQCEVGMLCEDFECYWPPTCEEAGTIHCDETVVGDNSAFTSQLASYSCDLWDDFDGPEAGYKFKAKVDDNLLVTVAGIGFGTEVVAMVTENSCAEAACIDESYDGQLAIDVEAGKTYFIVVESPAWEEAGTFMLSLVCQSTCEPKCQGKKCGDDGCNGSCGTCAEGTVCSENQCVVHDGCHPAPVAGCPGCECEECVCDWDFWCCYSAWDEDCADLCLDLCGGCPDLSGCGDGACKADVGENCKNCPADCLCGDQEVCFDGACCQPDCTDVECGDDGCGGECGDCEAGLYCLDGTCGPNNGCIATYEPGCGGCACEACTCEFWPECCTWGWDSLCVMVCEEYCGGCLILENCGDGQCDEAQGEGCGNCPADCQCDGDSSCYGGVCCWPECDGVDCGDDGCGGSCGSCSYDEVCYYGECMSGNGCVATYDSGCGGCACEDCVCDMDSYCCSTAWDDICVDECLEYCGGCEGGGDDCGDGVCDFASEDCESCPDDCPCTAGTTCYDGNCCTPDCEGKECGSDDCGGYCGDCDDDTYCSAQFQCVPTYVVEPEPDVVTQPEVVAQHDTSDPHDISFSGDSAEAEEIVPDKPEDGVGSAEIATGGEILDAPGSGDTTSPEKTVGKRSGGCSAGVPNATGLVPLLLAALLLCLAAFRRQARSLKP